MSEPYILVNASRMNQLRQEHSTWTVEHYGTIGTLCALVGLCQGPVYFGDEVIAAFLKTSVRKWHSYRDDLIRDGVLCLTDEGHIYFPDEANLIKFPGRGRKGIPSEVRAIAKRRSEDCCVYCGTLEGPFHHDHLLPVALGGGEDPSNIVLACAACNTSKSDRTLMEWVAYLRTGGGK